jgi:hypothetical protein
MFKSDRRPALLSLAVLFALAGPCRANPLTAGGIDWTKAPIVQLQLSLNFFRPGLLTLSAGQPVRLVFQNGDGRPHDFATRFFQYVSQRKGVRAGRLRVILQAAERVEYDVVPLRPGTYAVSSLMYEPPGLIGPARIVVN